MAKERKARRVTFEASAHLGVGGETVAGGSLESYFYLPPRESLSAMAPVMTELLKVAMARLPLQHDPGCPNAPPGDVPPMGLSAPPPRFVPGDRVSVLYVGSGVVTSVLPTLAPAWWHYVVRLDTSDGGGGAPQCIRVAGDLLTAAEEPAPEAKKEKA